MDKEQPSNFGINGEQLLHDPEAANSLSINRAPSSEIDEDNEPVQTSQEQQHRSSREEGMVQNEPFTNSSRSESSSIREDNEASLTRLLTPPKKIGAASNYHYLNPPERRSFCDKVMGYLEAFFAKIQFVKFDPSMPLFSDQSENRLYKMISCRGLTLFLAVMVIYLLLILRTFQQVGVDKTLAEQYYDSSIDNFTIPLTYEGLPFKAGYAFKNVNNNSLTVLRDLYLEKEGLPHYNEMKKEEQISAVKGLLEYMPSNFLVFMLHRYGKETHLKELMYPFTCSAELNGDPDRYEQMMSDYQIDGTVLTVFCQISSPTDPKTPGFPQIQANETLTLEKSSQLFICLQVKSAFVRDLIPDVQVMNQDIRDVDLIYRVRLSESEEQASMTKALPLQLRESLTIDKLEGTKKNWFKQIGLMTYSLYESHVTMDQYFTLPSSSATISTADPDKLYHDINFWIQPQFPVLVEKTKYFNGYNFLSSFGGFHSLIQTVIAFISAYFVYKSYTKYMAINLYTRQEQQRRATTGVKLASQKSKEEEIGEIRSNFSERLSQEGIYNLFDQVESQRQQIEVQQRLIEQQQEQIQALIARSAKASQDASDKEDESQKIQQLKKSKVE